MESRIVQGILSVEASKQKVSDPNGRYPVCMPGVGTGICERCGKQINQSNFTDPCSAVPPEQRWREQNS